MTGTLRRIGRYGKVTTDDLVYEDKGKKYRKWCQASVFLVPGYSGYSEVTMLCFWDVYEFGFGRGGIHNLWYLFKWKKDWYPEPAIFLVEDMLEAIRQKLSLKQDEVIRPRVFTGIGVAASFIIRYEAEKLIHERKAKEILFYTDSHGYNQKKWQRVKDTGDMELFEKALYKAINYVYEGRLRKTVIIYEHGNDLRSTMEYYFHRNGMTGYLNQKIVSFELRTPEELWDYLEERMKSYKMQLADIKEPPEKQKKKFLKETREQRKKMVGGPYIIERRMVFLENGEEDKTIRLEKGYPISNSAWDRYLYDIKEPPIEIFKSFYELPYIDGLMTMGK